MAMNPGASTTQCANCGQQSNAASAFCPYCGRAKGMSQPSAVPSGWQGQAEIQPGGFNATFNPNPGPQPFASSQPVYQQPYPQPFQQPYGQSYQPGYPLQPVSLPANKGAKMALGCAGIIMIGSVAPWATVESGYDTFTVNGTAGDGWIFIFLAVISAILSGLNIAKAGQVGWPIATLILLGAIGLFSLVDIGNITSIGDYYFDAVTVSWGLVLVLLAAIGGVVGSIMQIAGRKG